MILMVKKWFPYRDLSIGIEWHSLPRCTDGAFDAVLNISDTWLVRQQWEDGTADSNTMYSDLDNRITPNHQASFCFEQSIGRFSQMGTSATSWQSAYRICCQIVALHGSNKWSCFSIFRSSNFYAVRKARSTSIRFMAWNCYSLRHAVTWHGMLTAPSDSEPGLQYFLGSWETWPSRLSFAELDTVEGQEFLWKVAIFGIFGSVTYRLHSN